MAEQSHRNEMNAAIRAQRERHAVPRLVAPADEPPTAEQPQAQPQGTERKGLLTRLRRK